MKVSISKLVVLCSDYMFWDKDNLFDKAYFSDLLLGK